MGGQSELSPEELFLMSKHDLLAAKQKELEDLKAQYRRIQEERKRQKCLAESPSQATEIAKKLAASGKLITAKSGNKTSGFKRLHAKSQPEKQTPSEKVNINEEKDSDASVSQTSTEEPNIAKPLLNTPVAFKSAGLLNDLETSEKAVNQHEDDEDDLFGEQSFKKFKYDGDEQCSQPNCSFDELLRSQTRSDSDSTLKNSKDSWKRDPKHRKYGDGRSNSPTKWNNQSHSSPKTVEKGNTVFIGNAGLTANVLRRLAEPFGTIHRVDFDKGKKAFVTFTSFDAAEKAIASLHGLELTSEHFGDDIAAFATVDKTKLFVNYANVQRHKHIVQDLKNDWARISAGAMKPRPGLGSKSQKKVEGSTGAETDGDNNGERKQRTAIVYEDTPF